MKRIVALMLCLTFMLVLFEGCGVKPEKAIIGEWELTNSSIFDATRDIPRNGANIGVLSNLRRALYNLRLHIYDDGTIQYVDSNMYFEDFSGTRDGTYTLSEPKQGYTAIYVTWEDAWKGDNTQTFFFDSTNFLIISEYELFEFTKVVD